MGFIEAGFQCTAAFDLNPLAVRVHRTNLNSPAEVRDLSKGSNCLEMLSGIDVLLAGPPCQGFSTVGKRDLNDPRNHLLAIAGEIAAEVRPRLLIVENVRGVLSPPHNKYWRALEKRLRAAEYRVAELCCDASQHGVAQMRRRALMLAWRTQIDVLPELPREPQKVLNDVLRGINGASNHQIRALDPESEQALVARRIRAGQKLCNVREGLNSVHTWDIPEVFGKATEVEKKVLKTLLRLRRRLRTRDVGDADPVLASDVSRESGIASASILENLVQKGYVRKVDRLYDLAHTFNGKFRRLSWDRPSYTVDTRFTDPRCFLHPEEDRGLTVREAARIQGFPDSFKFEGSEREQIRFVGNAVPPPLAYSLAVLAQGLLVGRNNA
jgi:DNA (cytosine-5)-methyltransferase 1